MMDLQTYQRKISGLIKGTYTLEADDDLHLKSVAKSENLLITREIITWWRQLSLERYCRLTSSALKQLDIFDREINHLVTQWEFSPFVEELAHEFFARLKDHELEVIASLARFESALINVKQGVIDTVSVKWHHEPYAVLSAVTTGSGLSTIKPTGSFETIVSRELPGLFKVIMHDNPSHQR